MVRHIHSSSLYSESISSLIKQVDTFTDADDPGAGIITFTEVGSDQRAGALKDADPDWAAWVPSQSDVGIMWERNTFNKVLWKEPKKLTSKVWTDGQGRQHETWAASSLLKHNNDAKVFVSICHLPSHVQNGKKFYDNAQAKAWKSACSGWSDYWNKVRQDDHPDLALIVADWNVDFHMSTWRDKVQAYFPSMFLSWKGNMPPDGKGTHGERLIDGTMATTKASDAKLLKDDASSDHRPFGDAIPL